MKRGLEIGIEVIKPQAKEGNTSIQELHHRANDITYKYNRRYIPPQTALRLFEKLREIGIELKDVSVNERTKAKKDELLSIIRKQCLSLKSYYDSYVWSKDDAKQVDSTLRFQLAMYLKNKDTSDILSLLEDNKQIWDEMYLPCPNKEEIRTKKFIEMQNELLSRLNQQFQISAS